MTDSGRLPKQETKKEKKLDIIFIGGGIIQLTLATIFQARGYRCQVIEATEQLGGAWRDTAIGEAKVEIAPHIIPTKKGLRNLLNEAGLRLVPQIPKPQMELMFKGNKLRLAMEFSYLLRAQDEALVKWLLRGMLIFAYDQLKKLLSLNRSNQYQYFASSSGEAIAGLSERFVANGGAILLNTLAIIGVNRHWAESQSIDCKFLTAPSVFVTQNTVHSNYTAGMRSNSSSERTSTTHIFSIAESANGLGYLQFEHDQTTIDCMVVSPVAGTDRAFILVRAKTNRIEADLVSMASEVKDICGFSGEVAYVKSVKYSYWADHMEDLQSSGWSAFRGDNFSNGVIWGEKDIKEQLSNAAEKTVCLVGFD